MTGAPILFYLHIPKTAGRTFADYIHDQYQDSSGSREENGMFCSGIYYFPGVPGFMRPRNPVQPEGVFRTLRRSDLRAVVGHFTFGLHTLTDRPATYLTLFRHPVERVVSLYYHLKRWPVYRENEPWLERLGLKPLGEDTSLDEFIRTYPLPELDNEQTRRVAGEDPEYGACSRALLDTAMSNIERYFSFIGVTERFEESLRVAMAVHDWSAAVLETPAYEKNVNEQRPSASTLPRETREAILERNALDLELFSFANEWLDDRLRAARA